MFKIYAIKNKINDKIYIGQTKSSLKTRFAGHKSCINKGSKAALHCAMKTYGIDNFYIEILEECETQEIVNEREKFYIKEYKTQTPNGYNILEGGDAIPFRHSDTISQEHKENIKKAHKKSCKPIIQFDIETGRPIKEWESSKELMRAGYVRANIISLCKREKGFGYIYGSGWCYKEFYDSTLDKNSLITLNYNAHGSTIKCLDLEGNLVKLYYKIVDAARELKCNPSSIADCLTGRAKTCKSFKWEYVYSQNLQLQ